MEGTPTVLIEHGRVRRQSLAKELLTESELLTVLHRQGLSGLGEVDRCVLEPGGTFSVKGKQPATGRTPLRAGVAGATRPDQVSRCRRSDQLPHNGAPKTRRHFAGPLQGRAFSQLVRCAPDHHVAGLQAP